MAVTITQTDTPVATIEALPAVVSVTAPIVLNAALATMTIEALPADVTTEPVYGEMQGTLEIGFSFSAAMRAVDAVSSAAEGETRPVEVQLWDKSNTQMLAVLGDRYDLTWMEDLNDAGSGRFRLTRLDPKSSLVRPLTLIKYVYAGVPRFVSRVERRAIDLTDDQQAWLVTGRGALGLLADSALYPEYEVDRFTVKRRLFFFGSKRGYWYNPSQWKDPKGMRYKDVPKTHPWYKEPEDWPVKNAQWIWPTNPNRQAEADTAWFRREFTTDEEMWVTVFAAADNSAKMYLDGEYLGTASGPNSVFQRTLRLRDGFHVLASEVTNDFEDIEEVVPDVVKTTPSHAANSNQPYIGRGFSDGGMPYVNGDGSVGSGGPGGQAFDGTNSYWLSVGNHNGWSSAYEWVEGTFARQKVEAVTIDVKGGPYDVYISLKDGGGWDGTKTIPYAARVVDAGTRIRYVKKVRIPRDGKKTIQINPRMANRIRITARASWNSGEGSYRYRVAFRDIHVHAKKGQYVRGGNFAGLLCSVARTNKRGKIKKVLVRSKPEHRWLATTDPEPGWTAPEVLMTLLEESRDRSVLGTDVLNFGFTPFVDSYGMPWRGLERREFQYNHGDNLLSIAQKLAEDGDFDIWVDPETMVLHAAPVRGNERLSVFQPGHSVVEMGAESNRPVATQLLVESEFGWGEAGSFAGAVEYGRIEGLVSYGNALSLGEARRSGDKEIERSSVVTYDVDFEHTDLLGPIPFVHYQVGDTVRLPFDVGAPPVAYRVLSLKVKEGEAGELLVAVETDLLDAADLLTDPGLVG